MPGLYYQTIFQNKDSIWLIAITFNYFKRDIIQMQSTLLSIFAQFSFFHSHRLILNLRQIKTRLDESNHDTWEKLFTILLNIFAGAQ